MRDREHRGVGAVLEQRPAPKERVGPDRDEDPEALGHHLAVAHRQYREALEGGVGDVAREEHETPADGHAAPELAAEAQVLVVREVLELVDAGRLGLGATKQSASRWRRSACPSISRR